MKRTCLLNNILAPWMIFLCITICFCAAAKLRTLLVVCYDPFLAPLFQSATVQSALSLPLANKSWVLLSNATFRHAEHPQAHDGGCLLGKLLRLLPTKQKMSFSNWWLWSQRWFCNRVIILTTVKICISCLQQSPLTGKLGPESVAPWKTTNCDFLPLFCASFAHFTGYNWQKWLRHSLVELLPQGNRIFLSHRMVDWLLQFLLSAPLQQKHLRCDGRWVFPPKITRWKGKKNVKMTWLKLKHWYPAAKPVCQKYHMSENDNVYLNYSLWLQMETGKRKKKKKKTCACTNRSNLTAMVVTSPSWTGRSGWTSFLAWSCSWVCRQNSCRPSASLQHRETASLWPWPQRPFIHLEVSSVTLRSATWSRQGSAPPAPACPAETPPCLAASDTDSTWHWGRGSHIGWPAVRIGRESGESLGMMMFKKKEVLTPVQFRNSRIWGSPPSPSPQGAARPRWTRRRSTLPHAPAWRTRRPSPSWSSQCRRGSLLVLENLHCRRQDAFKTWHTGHGAALNIIWQLQF